MGMTTETNTKRAENKARRDAEKAARKAANIQAVEATKAAKLAKVNAAPEAPKAAPKQPDNKIRDVWHALALEKQGATINLATGTFTFNQDPTSAEVVVAKVRQVKPEHRQSHIGYASDKLVCVVKADGSHVRVRKSQAMQLVEQGGRFIPKHEYKGTITDPVTREKVSVDWAWKQTGTKPVADEPVKPRKAPRRTKTQA
jgi:hypothetical protein